jgi:hypothetical protein
MDGECTDELQLATRFKFDGKAALHRADAVHQLLVRYRTKRGVVGKPLTVGAFFRKNLGVWAAASGERYPSAWRVCLSGERKEVAPTSY